MVPSWVCSSGRGRLAGVLAAAAMTLGVAAATPHALADTAAPTAPARVTATPGGLRLDGAPWWPTGVNAYELATDWSINAGCGAMVDLDQFFGSLAPGSLTRFDAFQSQAMNTRTGQLDPGPIDAVFAAAAKHGQLVLPVLSPQDGACHDGPFKQRDFYQDGWTQPQSGNGIDVLSFQAWMDYAVARWRSSTALAGWELVGEPEPTVCTDTACSWQTRQCPSDSGAVLRSFMDRAGERVRGADPNHLIYAGLLGGGQCGSGGDDYQRIAASPGVDVVEYHDYGADGVALPGDQWNGLARRISQASAVGKPLLVAEVGELAGSCESLGDRANHLRTKLTGQQSAGTAGALLWAWVPDPRPADCTMDIGSGDPAFAVLDSLSNG